MGGGGWEGGGGGREVGGGGGGGDHLLSWSLVSLSLSQAVRHSLGVSGRKPLLDLITVHDLGLHRFKNGTYSKSMLQSCKAVASLSGYILHSKIDFLYLRRVAGHLQPEAGA